VVSNTIYKPGRWVVRILQENANSRFAQCGENTFSNNLIYYENLHIETNIGANTRPATFRFAGNFWFNSSATQLHQPVIPVSDSTVIFGQNPMFMNPGKYNFGLKESSPASGRINFEGEPVTDFYNRPFKALRSFGAVESE